MDCSCVVSSENWPEDWKFVGSVGLEVSDLIQRNAFSSFEYHSQPTKQQDLVSEKQLIAVDDS